VSANTSAPTGDSFREPTLATDLPHHTGGHDEAADAHGGGHGHGHNPLVAHQFDDLAQQKEAGILGMWAFLATEIMFFGGALLAYAIYRNYYHYAFAAASNYENWQIGLVNTFVLLFSSYTVVLAVHKAQHGDNKGVYRWVMVTIALGLVFLIIKAFEYTHLYHERLVPGMENFGRPPGHAPLFPEYLERPAQIFFSFYFSLTGIHALHMVIGVGIMLYIAWLAKRNEFEPDYYNPMEIAGLYWHFVDIVWIFLYPLLYLVDRNYEVHLPGVTH
jgi:cytochrome c oxidase subunit III